MISILEYVIILVLTFFVSSAIIKYSGKIWTKKIRSIKYTQSVIHNKTKSLVQPSSNIKKEYRSQSKNYISEHMIKIIMVDNRAYWVKDNVFFVADMNDGSVVPETTRPIDTSRMSKQDVEKMLFILDNLKEKNNDSGSAGN
jgi:hypothetical protein